MNQPPPEPRSATVEMLGEEAARAHILSHVAPLPAETVPLLRALGRYAAAEGRAVQPLPAFDNSAMDGYALSLPEGTSTLPPGTTLHVRGEQAAGPDQGLRAIPGEAIRIFTGAPVPVGAGAVVMQEDVDRSGDRIVLRESVERGEFIRRAGGDLACGQRLFGPGQRLTPQRLGLLASQGVAEIAVGGVPRVAVLATGDELRSPGQPLRSGEIYESNGVLLASLVGSLGAEVTILERARDDRDDLDARLAAGLGQHHALIVAGGVSVGERDFVKERLAAAGSSLNLWRVRVQPGKPFLYGRGPTRSDGPRDGTHVFGLPGNPVSAFVTFLLFVRPALLRLMGAADDELSLPTFPAVAGEALANRGDRPHYLRGTLDGGGGFRLAGRQESHALFALSCSRALVRVEPGETVPVGGPVRAYLWSL